MLKLPLLLPLLLAACAGVEPIPDLELNPVPYRSAISSSLLAGDLDGACLAGDEAAQAIPDDAVAAILRPEAYTAAGRFTRAIDCLGRAVEHATDDSTLAHALHNRGVLKMRAADPAGALLESARAQGRDPAARTFLQRSRSRPTNRKTSRRGRIAGNCFIILGRKFRFFFRSLRKTQALKL